MYHLDMHTIKNKWENILCLSVDWCFCRQTEQRKRMRSTWIFMPSASRKRRQARRRNPVELTKKSEASIRCKEKLREKKWVILQQVDIVGMFVTETGSHKVVPASITRAKMVEYKVMNETGERGGGGGGGGGGTHLAATVKNTVRRLLRRTKSHRDTPSSNTSMIMQTTNGNQNVNNLAIVRNKTNNVNDPTARRSQPPLPTSFEQHSSRNSYGRRHSRLRVKFQVRERRLTEKSFPLDLESHASISCANNISNLCYKIWSHQDIYIHIYMSVYVIYILHYIYMYINI